MYLSQSCDEICFLRVEITSGWLFEGYKTALFLLASLLVKSLCVKQYCMKPALYPLKILPYILYKVVKRKFVIFVDSFAGYCFLIFQDEMSVHNLTSSCFMDDNKLYWCVSSPTMKDKPVSWNTTCSSIFSRRLGLAECLPYIRCEMSFI